MMRICRFSSRYICCYYKYYEIINQGQYMNWLSDFSFILFSKSEYECKLKSQALLLLGIQTKHLIQNFSINMYFSIVWDESIQKSKPHTFHSVSWSQSLWQASQKIFQLIRKNARKVAASTSLHSSLHQPQPPLMHPRALLTTQRANNYPFWNIFCFHK